MRKHKLRCFTCNKRVGDVEDDFTFEVDAAAVCGDCCYKLIWLCQEFVTVIKVRLDNFPDWTSGKKLLAELLEIRGVRS